MKPGSLVACINNSVYADAGMVVPSLEAIYTVREIVPMGTVIKSPNGLGKVTVTEHLIYLEEIENPKMSAGFTMLEPAYCIADFREVLPPMENIEQMINENTLEKELA